MKNDDTTNVAEAQRLLGQFKPVAAVTKQFKTLTSLRFHEVEIDGVFSDVFTRYRKLSSKTAINVVSGVMVHFYPADVVFI